MSRLIISRPPIERICMISAEGNPHIFQIGFNATEILEVTEGGRYVTIPWVEVYEGSQLVARICQHKLEHILYRKQ